MFWACTYRLRWGCAARFVFRPNAPAGQEGRWIKTVPGKGWFAYIQNYGPEEAAFDKSWKRGDVQLKN